MRRIERMKQHIKSVQKYLDELDDKIMKEYEETGIMNKILVEDFYIMSEELDLLKKEFKYEYN